MTPRKESLEELAEIRADLEHSAATAYRTLLDRALEEAGGDAANVTDVARRAGIARATIYNELARRQEHADTLEGNGHPPAPAPADVDVELSGIQRYAVELIAAGRNPLAEEGPRYRRTIAALRRRGLILEDELGLTELGARVAGELKASA